MSGLYIHIPFCKQACHYCDFHFTTTLKHRSELVHALCKEIHLRKDELRDPLRTIYFGGGTPSLLNASELKLVFAAIYENFEVDQNAEITLEANPDDLKPEKLVELSKSPINRLSIGVQSFFEDDLKMMNRAHSESEAYQCIVQAKRYFTNISMDLIYGIPGMSADKWIQNLQIAFELEVPHISCYALTVEPKTALKHYIDKGVIPPVDDAMAQEHHAILVEAARKNGYVNYEFSNFGLPGHESQNNLAYWLGKPYVGIGPSAHSYDGTSRSWNVSNNTKYRKALEADKLPLEREELSTKDRFNEYVMTRLRTMWGIHREDVESHYGTSYWAHVESQIQSHLKRGFVEPTPSGYRISDSGKFYSDGIASDLFLVHLKEKP